MDIKNNKLRERACITLYCYLGNELKVHRSDCLVKARGGSRISEEGVQM